MSSPDEPKAPFAAKAAPAFAPAPAAKAQSGPAKSARVMDPMDGDSKLTMNNETVVGVSTAKQIKKYRMLPTDLLHSSRAMACRLRAAVDASGKRAQSRLSPFLLLCLDYALFLILRLRTALDTNQNEVVTGVLIEENPQINSDLKTVFESGRLIGTNVNTFVAKGAGVLKVDTNESVSAGLHNPFPMGEDANDGELFDTHQDSRFSYPTNLFPFYVSCLTLQELNVLLFLWFCGQDFITARQAAIIAVWGVDALNNVTMMRYVHFEGLFSEDRTFSFNEHWDSFITERFPNCPASVQDIVPYLRANEIRFWLGMFGDSSFLDKFESALVGDKMLHGIRSVKAMDLLVSLDTVCFVRVAKPSIHTAAAWDSETSLEIHTHKPKDGRFLALALTFCFQTRFETGFYGGQYVALTQAFHRCSDYFLECRGLVQLSVDSNILADARAEGKTYTAR
jgi:hypothetical protein